MPTTTITTTDIVSEFGAYYLNSGQNMKDLVKQVYRPSKTQELFTPFTTDDTIIRKGESRFTRILQPFQKAFTPIGSLTFKPVTIPLFNMKIDLQLTPDDIVKSWLGFLEGDGLDRKKWPLIKWLLEVHVFEQAQRDWEVNEIYLGEFDEPVVGTAGDEGTAMDGIKKIINDWIDNGRTSTISSGAAEADPVDFCTQIEEWVKQLPKDYWKQPMTIAMSEDLELRYKDGKDAKYNTNYAKETVEATVKNFPNIKVGGYQSHEGDEKWWCTPKWNAVRGMKKKALMQTVEVESDTRTVNIFSDWWDGVGFIIPELIFTNDQDLS